MESKAKKEASKAKKCRNCGKSTETTYCKSCINEGAKRFVGYVFTPADAAEIAACFAPEE